LLAPASETATQAISRSLPEDDLRWVSARMSLWEKLRNARILMTGGTGFFGRWLTECILYANREHRLGIELSLLTRVPERIRESMPWVVEDEAVSLLRGDINDFAAPADSFDWLIHGAGSSDARLYASDPQRMHDTIVGGTRRTLAIAREQPLHGFLFISSGAVYGRQPPGLSHVDEGFAPVASPAGQAVYAEAKREAEALCLDELPHKLPPKIARCFAFVGPGLPLDQHFAIGNFIRDALAHRAIRIAGDGSPLRSYLYTADLAVWLLTILLEGRPGRAYNVGSDEPIDIQSLAGLVDRTVGAARGVTVMKARSSQPPERYVPSIARVRSELGLDVWHPLDLAIRKTAQWYGARA
jgi:dTDP-glucose 4,6-dehydratase